MRPNSHTLKDLFLFGSQELKNHNIVNYKKESEWILLHILQKDYSWFLCNEGYLLSNRQRIAFIDCINKRKDHIPLQLILGIATFYGRDFDIFPDVFIPRQETEQIIDLLVDAKYNNALDLCSGSGVLAITLYLESIASHVDACDISDICIENINQNIKKHHCNKNVSSYKFDIINETPQKKYDLIVCNPPYIKLNEIDTLMHDVKNHDPLNSLTDYQDGLSFYRRIQSIIHDILSPKGLLLIEFGGEQQVDDLELIFTKYEKKVFNDISNQPRIMKIHI